MPSLSSVERTGLRLKSIDRLTSITATAGDTLILTSDGTNQTLKWSRSNSRLKFRDPDNSSYDVMELYSSTLSRGGGTPTFPGVAVRGPMVVGPGTSFSGEVNSTPGYNSTIFSVAADMSDYEDVTNGTIGWTNIFYIAGVADGDAYGATMNTALYGIIFQGNFDSTDGAGTGQAFNYNAHLVQVTGSTSKIGGMLGGATKFDLFQTNMNASAGNGGATWTELNGIDVSTLNMSGLTGVTRASSLKVGSPSVGTTKFSGNFGGNVKVSGTNRLALGQNQNTAGINDIRSKTSTGTIMVFGTNSVDQWELSTAALYPATNGGQGIGQNGNGLLDAWFLDTSAAFEDRIVFTSSTVLTADRTLTWDMNNVSATIKFNAAATVTLDNWFDQAVKTTSDSLHNTVRQSAVTTQTGTYAILTTDHVVLCNSSTAFTVTLPTAVGVQGKEYIIKNINTGVITIATTSSQTIDGNVTATLFLQYDELTVISDNANWYIA